MRGQHGAVASGQAAGSPPGTAQQAQHPACPPCRHPCHWEPPTQHPAICAAPALCAVLCCAPCCAHHVEGHLGQVVVLALQHALEVVDGVLQLHVLACGGARWWARGGRSDCGSGFAMCMTVWVSSCLARAVARSCRSDQLRSKPRACPDPPRQPQGQVSAATVRAAHSGTQAHPLNHSRESIQQKQPVWGRTWRAGEHLGHSEGLGQEALDLTGTRHSHLVLLVVGEQGGQGGARRVRRGGAGGPGAHAAAHRAAGSSCCRSLCSRVLMLLLTVAQRSWPPCIRCATTNFEALLCSCAHLLRQLIHAQNGNDILQVAVVLQHLLHATRHCRRGGRARCSGTK